MKNLAILLPILVLLLTGCYKETVVNAGEDWTAATHGSSASPNYDVVFNQNTVNRLDIVMDRAYWDVMLADMTDIYGDFGGSSSSTGGGPGGGGPPTGGGGGTGFSDQTPVYVPCSVFLNDMEWYKVGIRFKGNSSLMTPWNNGIYKLPFRLEFDYFEDDYPEITDQRFYGFQQLALGNNYDDMSLMREKSATDLFREFGVPAPQTAFIRLYIDYGDGPVYFGLYTVVEIVFDTMLETQFGSNSGNCYKPDGTGASFADGTFSSAAFEHKSGNNEGDWSDIEAVFSALHSSNRTSNPEAWRAELDAVFDTDHFLKYLAANQVLQNWDTYGVMTHNYYLYTDPATNKVTWIPWDNNESLQDGKGALDLDFSNMTGEWPLISFLYADDTYRASYESYLESFTETAFESGRMQSIYANQQALIENYVTGTEAEQDGYTFLTSSGAFGSGVSELQTHVSDRSVAVSNYLP